MRVVRLCAFVLALFAVLSIPCACAAPRACEDANLLAFIEALCAVHGLEPELVYAVIETESSWRAGAVNPAGNCLGLMQISTVHRAWLRETMGVEDLFDPYQNVMAGIRMLSDYVNQYGDIHMALMCYNCGVGGAQQRFAQGQYTSGYSRVVAARMADLQANPLRAG